MTALTHRSTLRGPANGGVAARRAVIRWAWRMFRREWRRQLLVIALLTVAVAAAIGSVTIAYNSAAADNAEFGSANHLIRFDGANPEELDAGLAAARERFGTTDVIGHRTLEVPGSVDPVEFRSQDPRGPYGDARLALHRGSYPEGPGHVAVSDGVATLLGLEIGDPLSLDGRRRDVVGIVENPLDRSDREACPARARHGRHGRRRHRGTDRGDRRSRALASDHPDARAGGRPSHRSAEPAVDAVGGRRLPRGPGGHRRRLVAGAGRRPHPRHAGAVGTPAEAQAHTPLDARRRGLDRRGNRQPRALGPGQGAADRHRDHGDDPRHPAPGPTGDPPLRPSRPARPDRPAPGAAGPRPLPGPLRGGTRRDHARPRDRGGGGDRRGGRGE